MALHQGDHGSFRKAIFVGVGHPARAIIAREPHVRAGPDMAVGGNQEGRHVLAGQALRATGYRVGSIQQIPA